jgi:hypothetical protein
MTMTRSKNSTFELRICGWSIISGHTGWSCNGILTCLICMNDTSCFHLKFGGKIFYFDCHRYFLPLYQPFMLDSDRFKNNIILEEPLR